MTFELNIKCIWKHPATNTHLEIIKIEWSDTDQPLVITVISLRQLQPGIWKLPIKQGSQDVTNLLSAIHEYLVFPKIKNTHPLTRYLVKKSLQHCPSLVARDKDNKTKTSES